MFKLTAWIAPWFAPRSQKPTEAPQTAKQPAPGDTYLRAAEELAWQCEALHWENERQIRQLAIGRVTDAEIAEWTAASDRRAWSQRMHSAKRAKKAK